MPEIERSKTGGLTTLGVLSVVLGALSLVGAAWALLQPETHQALIKQTGAPQLLFGRGLTGAYADAIVNGLLAAMLFAAGVGLLKLRKWGRSAARWYAMGRIGWSAVALVLAIMGPIAGRPSPEQLGTFPTPYVEFFKTRFLTIALAEVFAALVLSTVFAVILLCLLSRKSYQDKLT